MINILPGGIGVDAATLQVSFSTLDTTSMQGAGPSGTFSNNNRTLTVPSGAGNYQGVMGTLSHTSGKYYFEVTVNALGNMLTDNTTYSGIGIYQKPSWTGQGGLVGYDQYSASLAVTPAATTWKAISNYSGTATFTTPVPASGQVIGVAVSFNTGTGSVDIWFRLQANWLNAGTPQTAFPVSPDFVSLWANSIATVPGITVPNAAQYTINTGNTAFVNAPPSGYVAWG